MRGWFPASSAAAACLAVPAGLTLDSEFPAMLMILPPLLCVKLWDRIEGDVARCAPVWFPGVLRPPPGTPLPENSKGGVGVLAVPFTCTRGERYALIRRVAAMCGVL